MGAGEHHRQRVPPPAPSQTRDGADPPPVSLPGSVFVGRERELEELLAGLENAFSGHGGLFLLGGEPGIGKSRLADELASEARERGAQVLWGRCWEAGGAPAYWPWVQSIRSYIRDRDPEGVRVQMGSGLPDIAQMLPELRELFPDVPVPLPVESESARFRLFDSTTAFLRNAARAQPLVLVLDDLHAADTPSLLLLRFVAAELAESRIVLIGAYRDIDVEPDHPLAATAAELAREPAAHQLSLRGLSRPDVLRYIELSVGVRPSDAFVAAVHEETEGNPLFVGELVRLLAAEGRLEVPEGSALRFAIPQGIREVIDRRLRRLSEECIRVLTLASVLGREFDLQALARVAELEAVELLQVLDEAMAARVVTEVPGALGRLRFAHQLIRDTLYDDLAASRRLALHRRVGEALETLYAQNPEPHLAELAHHFFEAAPGGEVDKAIDYARRAGDRAARLLAFEEAARLYEMALQALELEQPRDEEARCELLLRLGDARARAGDMPAAKQTFLQAADVARRLSLPEQLGWAALGYGGRFVWEAGRGDPCLLPLLQEALAALGEEGNALRAKLLARLAGGPLRDEVVRERRSPPIALNGVAAARPRAIERCCCSSCSLGCSTTADFPLLGRCQPPEAPLEST